MSHAVDIPELKQIEQWILRRRPERESVPADVDLIENRIIDSLTFAEFVLLIEEVSGSAIDMDNIDIDDFRTLNAIGERFFGGTVSQ